MTNTENSGEEWIPVTEPGKNNNEGAGNNNNVDGKIWVELNDSLKDDNEDNNRTQNVPSELLQTIKKLQA